MPMNFRKYLPGGGDFKQGFDQNKVPAVQGFYLELHMENLITPLFPSSRGDVVANDWYIKFSTDIESEIRRK